MSETKSKIIGIDLGTSNSAAAFMNMGRPEFIPSSEGAGLYGKAFPSVVAFPQLLVKLQKIILLVEQ